MMQARRHNVASEDVRDAVELERPAANCRKLLPLLGLIRISVEVRKMSSE
jgi:hypothetical protein